MEKKNLHTSGALHVDGGDYNEVHVSGSIKVDGNITCETLRCSGATKIGGALDCKGELSNSGSVKVGGAVSLGTARISGSFSCEGDLRCEGSLRASGSVRCGGDLRVGEGHFSGACSVGGGVHAGSLACSGKLTAEKDVEAEEFQSSGRLEIHGLLNAERIEISADGTSDVGDIGGGTILVRRDGRVFCFGIGRRGLRVRTIEGDRVELEYTQAKVVRGKYVRIGAGCEIDRVEYSGDLSVEGGVVREQVRV